MKKIGVLLILCFLVLSCNYKEKPKKPDNLISKDKMEQILYDLYIINAAKGVNRKILEANGLMPETYVLSKHNIDSAQFANSNNFYAYNADEYKGMVENVKARLEKEKKEFEELEKIEGQEAKRRRDSITKVNRKKKDSIVKTINNSKKPDN